MSRKRRHNATQMRLSTQTIDILAQKNTHGMPHYCLNKVKKRDGKSGEVGGGDGAQRKFQ